MPLTKRVACGHSQRPGVLLPTRPPCPGAESDDPKRDAPSTAAREQHLQGGERGDGLVARLPHAHRLVEVKVGAHAHKVAVHGGLHALEDAADAALAQDRARAIQRARVLWSHGRRSCRTTGAGCGRQHLRLHLGLEQILRLQERKTVCGSLFDDCSQGAAPSRPSSG